MNCPQCQTVNGPNAAFCGNCGGRLAPAAAPTAASPGAGGGAYPPPPGAPLGYNPPGAAPAGPDAPGGYGPPQGYSAPGGYNSVPPPPPYVPPGGQVPGGYPPGQYQGPQGQYQPPYVPGSSSSGLSLPPVNFDLSRLTTIDRVIGGATLVTMISLWLPWFSASYLGRSSGSISGTGDHGWLWLEFILALALLAYLAARAAWDRLPFNLPVAHETLLIAATALQFLLVLIGFLAMPSTDGIEGISVSWDFGAFLALIGSVVAAGPVVYPAVKTYLDNRKAAGPRTY